MPRNTSRVRILELYQRIWPSLIINQMVVMMRQLPLLTRTISKVGKRTSLTSTLDTLNVKAAKLKLNHPESKQDLQQQLDLRSGEHVAEIIKIQIP
jgi:hypothetical protein